LKRSRILIHSVTGLAIALGALWLTYRSIDLDGLLGLLRTTRVPVLLLVLPPLAVSYVFRILRWQVLLRPLRKVGFGTASTPLLTGFMVNSVLPARIGEVVRALLLSRRTGVPKAASLGTVVLDRIFDGLTLTAMTLAVMAGMWSRLDPGFRTGLVAASAGYGILLLGAVALRKWRDRAAAAIAAPLSKLGLHGAAERLRKVLASFSEGLATIQNGREVLVLSLLSAGVWLSLAVSIIPAYMALGLPFEPYHPVLVLVLAAFGMLVPTPAGTGTVHAALTVVLPELTALTPAQAGVFALVFHASQFLPIILAGLVAAVHEGVKPLDVIEAGEEDVPH
jgi:hypothetical protein